MKHSFALNLKTYHTNSALAVIFDVDECEKHPVVVKHETAEQTVHFLWNGSNHLYTPQTYT